MYVFLVHVLRLTPNHIPLKYRCLHYGFVGCRHVYLMGWHLGWVYARADAKVLPTIYPGVRSGRGAALPAKFMPPPENRCPSRPKTKKMLMHS
jgi:hypothetical protein